MNEMMNENSTWSYLKDQGTQHFESRRFNEAADCWSQAYDKLTALQRRDNHPQETNQTEPTTDRNTPSTSTQLFYQKERQYLLSNLVACKLHILGELTDTENTFESTLSLAQSILVLAKECIQLDDTWSKGYVRLASAYIALDTLLMKSDEGRSVGRRQHSNDACIALQTALRLDPSNRKARTMLVQELSRRDRGEPTRNTSSTDPSLTNNLHQQQEGEDIDKTPNALTWSQRWKLELQAWLQRHPFFTTHDARDIYIVLFVLLLLYISFDGRFGFDSQSHPMTTITTITERTPSTRDERIDIPQSRSRTRWEPEFVSTAHINNKKKNKKKRHGSMTNNQILHQQQQHVTDMVPIWIPLGLMVLTTLLFLNPAYVPVRQPFLGRFPFFRGGYYFRQVPVQGFNIFCIATIILFPLLIQFLGNGNPPIVIRGYMGPLGFPGMGMMGGGFPGIGMMGGGFPRMGIHFIPYARDIFARQWFP